MWKVSGKLWTAIKEAQNVVRMSNGWLRACVLGGDTHLDIKSACTLFRLVLALRRAGRCAWNLAPGSPLWTLRNWSKNRGGRNRRVGLGRVPVSG